MTPVLEFRTPIPVETKQGRGYALWVEVDNHVQYWTIVLNESRAFVTLPQDKILAQPSYTHGRGIDDEQMREMIDKGRLMKKGTGKVKKVMREYEAGKLHSGSKEGPVVKKPAQAEAIALSEARKAGAKIPKK